MIGDYNLIMVLGICLIIVEYVDINKDYNFRFLYDNYFLTTLYIAETPLQWYTRVFKLEKKTNTLNIYAKFVLFE